MPHRIKILCLSCGWLLLFFFLLPLPSSESAPHQKEDFRKPLVVAQASVTFLEDGAYRRALQEAMVNALAHRDYELVDPVRFTSYSDRIEFISPGSLPFGLTLEALRKRSVTPRWRNQSLAWFLSRLQLAQAEGQGIQTIRSTMKAVGCPPPRFDATEVSVSCVLRAHPRFRPVGVTATRERAPRAFAKPDPKAPRRASKKSAPIGRVKRG